MKRIALVFYNLFIRAYHFGVVLAALTGNAKAKLWLKGRKGQWAKIEEDFKNVESDNQVIWFHCASLGEFEQGRPVLERLKEKHEKRTIVLTFFSPSGYEIRKDYALADFVYYLPEDTRANAQRFVNLINPKVAVFVKYEFWYHYIEQLHHHQVKLLSIAAIFRKEQLFFKPYGQLFTQMLKRFDHLFVQNQNSLELLTQLGIKDVQLAGDTRFDRVITHAQAVPALEIIKQFKAEQFLIIGGSTWEPEERLLKAISDQEPRIKLVIAPHDISSAHIHEIEELFGTKTLRYSQVSGADLNEYQVLIIDNIGMLSSLYQYGDAALVGGGFGKGLHNILEAAVFGMPVCFGPNIKKFPEAQQLIEANGASIIINNENSFSKKVRDWLESPKIREAQATASRDFIYQHRGATEKIIRYIESEEWLFDY